MAEDIILRYRAETDDLIRELNVLIDKQDQLADETEKASKSFDKAATNEVQAAKRRKDAIAQEIANIEKLKQSKARAFDPVIIDRFNKAIGESERRIKTLSTATEKEAKKMTSAFSSAGSQIKNIGLGIAAGFGAAFTIDALVNFAKSSVNAFVDAEKNANKLKFAITEIGNESEEAFNRLIKQSGELQKITIFSDDAIQQAQAALSAFGLTADEIEALIPKLADFATVTGQDIVSATQQVGAGLEGAGREFKKYGIEVSATATRQENLNQIMDGFSKFAGAANEATKTLAGQLELARNEADELKESIGERLAPVFVNAGKAFLGFVDDVLAGFGLLNDTSFEDDLGQRINLVAAEVTGQVDVYVKAGVALAEARAKALDAVEDRIFTDLARLATKTDEASKKKVEQLYAESAAVKELREQYAKQVEAEKKLAEQKAEEQSQKEIEARKKVLAELLKLDEQYTESSIRLSEQEAEQVRENARRTKELVEEALKNPVEIPIELQVPDERQAQQKAEEVGGSLADSLIGRFNQEIQASLSLINELTDIFNNFSDARVDQITKNNEAYKESLTAEEEALNESYSKRLISEAEYRKQSDAIEAKKIENEKKIQAAIAKERRKQALINKIAASFEIGIQTAINVVRALGTPPVPNIALAALAGALGAAQLAAVASQPIPQFAKGTKGKKGSGMAIVGEQGPEMTYLPDGAKVLPAKQTKTYGELFDAMYDNKLENYIYKNYITPALEKQRMKYEGAKQESFANNIVNSIQYGGLTTSDLIYANRKGTNIKNADEIAQAIAKALKTQSPDLWRM